MRDKEELRWYLTSGLSMFERSTFGAILDVLESRAYVSQKCHKCWGEGILSTDTKHRDQDGRVEVLPSGSWCPKCKGTGCIPVRITSDDLVVIQTVHARTPGASGGYREAPQDEALTRYALVSRRLSRMPVGLRIALCAAYGDAGEAHSGTGLRGRAWACAPLTDAGRKLLQYARETRDAHPDRVHTNEEPVALLTAIAQLDGANPLPQRTKLLAKAVEDGWQTLLAAEQAWDKEG